ncbi:ATP-binding cassette domain-containing protein [Rhodobacteraceae bacterium 2CG4]|uniref:ATP-binding cassette domain-containing protein n=1 Tax=Halovulum marinum TaxID=2662447 RepID=A0A6L5Z3G0_9RHOB|nr:ABC transporter ATP-binding protein [Halovulum marinum]MSU91113.1 ATP-binding cassette domain-containing protein [Halovulum marinum]
MTRWKEFDVKRGSSGPLLQVQGLEVEFRTGGRVVHAVNGIDIDVRRGETVAVLGESGSGKSITFEAILGTLDSPPGHVTGGRAEFEGQNLFDLSPRRRRAICGDRIGMIFQDPLSALNPVYTVGWQMAEMYRVHRHLGRAEARRQSMDMLARVGIPDVQRRIDNYPHEFSGGMRQRLVIAMALAVDPALVIADEPTTALDVTVEAQILALLRDLQRERGMGLILITHSMAVAAEIADRICVMYAGQVVERGDVRTLFGSPAHPYTAGLLHSLPGVAAARHRRLTPIPGQPPDLAHIPPGCPFHPRCPRAEARCRAEPPALRPVGDGQREAACHFAEELLAAAPTAQQDEGHAR